MSVVGWTVVYGSWVTPIDQREMVNARMRWKAVEVLLVGFLLMSLAACGRNGTGKSVSTTPTRTPTTNPTPTLHPTCVAVAGLTDCQADSDCIVVDRIGCCPCNMGGQQGAINQGKEAEFFSQLEACCSVVCPAVVLCESNLVAACQHGTCNLATVTATATPTPTMTPTPTSISATTYRLTQGSTILSSPAPPGNNTGTLEEPLSGTFVVVPQPPGPGRRAPGHPLLPRCISEGGCSLRTPTLWGNTPRSPVYAGTLDAAVRTFSFHFRNGWPRCLGGSTRAYT